MNNRNNLDSRNFVYALLSGLRLAFYLAVLALILGGVFFVQCEKPKANLRNVDLYRITDDISVLVISCFKYNIRKQYMLNNDWTESATIKKERIELLYKILDNKHNLRVPYNPLYKNTECKAYGL